MSEKSLSPWLDSPEIGKKKGDRNIKHRILVPKSLRERVMNLFDAVHEGDEDKLSLAVGKVNSDELNRRDGRGLTVLHYATRSGNSELCKILINHGAQVNVRSDDGRESTPLHIASRFNCVEVAKTLIKNGANANQSNSQGITPLHYAAQRGSQEMADLLLDLKEVNVNARDGSQLTSLHWACIHGNEEVCKLLLRRKADILARSVDLMTPLHFAVFCGNPGVVELILKEAESLHYVNTNEYVNSTDQDQNTALHLAVEAGSLESVSLCLESGAEVNATRANAVTSLHIAALKGNLPTVRLLVAKGANIKTRDAERKTALHKAASLNRLEVIKYLIHEGAQLDAKDCENKTPFLEAVASGQTETSKLLLECGADVYACDVKMKNCIHLAVKHEQLETLKMLLSNRDACENLYRSDVHERVPLHYAARNPDKMFLQALLTKQSRISFQDENHLSPLHIAAASGILTHVHALFKVTFGVNERDVSGQTPLHKAAMNGHRKVCFALIQMGADINSKDNNRWTPLMWATKSGEVKTVQALLHNKASIDLENIDGNTALHITAVYGCVSVTKLLLDHGADMAGRNKYGQSVIDLAVKHDADDVVMTVIMHERWQEIMERKDSVGQTHMEVLIEHFPDAAKIVMDRCVTHSYQGGDYCVTYDFTLIDPGPDDSACIDGNRFFGPMSMVLQERKNLLTHPLVLKILELKWHSLGRYVFYVSFLTYIVFLLLFTVFIIEERYVVTFEVATASGVSLTNVTASQLFNTSSSLSQIVPYIIFAFMTFHIIKEIVQIYIQRGTYFTEFSNLVEWIMYTTCLFFMLSYILPRPILDQVLRRLNDPSYVWILGTVSIFLCYMNLILFFRRFKLYGSYVVMFIEVSKTVMRVLLVFSVFIFAFAIVFFILFKEQDAFKTLMESVVKVTVMTIGELDYVSGFVETINRDKSPGRPLNPFPEAAFVFCCIFIFIMAVVLVNLLIGLAVGDIDTIQQNATMNRLAMQVQFVADVEDKYPRWITRMVYKPRLTVWPNREDETCLSRFWYFMMGRRRLTTKTKLKRKKGEEKNEEYAEVKYQVGKTKRRVKALATLITAQTRLLTAVVKKVDPTAEYDKIISAAANQDSYTEPADDEEELEEEEGLIRRMGRLGNRILKRKSLTDKELNQ